MKVLLVEDEVELADVLARNLRVRGHDVRTEPTAEGAILDMAQEWPDVLILDINLPDGTGWDVLRRLGERDREQVRVIVISAAPVSQKRLAEFQPANWFLKPFPVEALARAVGNEPVPANAERWQLDD
ncbi:MAG TPA: response regulator [Dehalococcoidia bacterium]